MIDWGTCDWGGFTSVLNSLNFWRGWLISSLKYTPRGTEAALLWRFFRTGDPLASAVLLCLVFALVCFLLSLPTNRHSWVDKLWSIVPVAYFWHFAVHDRLSGAGRGAAPHSVPLDPRMLAMAALATLWGGRLTWNFARKGGYRWHEEDYRWPFLRQRVHPFLFLIFNITFISVIQHVLLLLLCTPAYLAWQNVGRALGPLDAAAAALVAFFIWLEAKADQQQWAFQAAKHGALQQGRSLPPSLARGFITTGLFRFSRHPNFWAEQCIWWSMYLFGVAASGRWLNWTLSGPLFLSMLFQGSTWLTELISAAKYPTYAQYQQTTSRLMPWFPGEPAEGKEKGSDDEEESEEEEEEEEEEGTEAEEEEEASSEEGKEEEEEEEQQQQVLRRRSASARKSRSSGRRASAAAAEAPARGKEEEAEEEEEDRQQRRPRRSLAAPATASRGRPSQRRASRAAAAAEEEPAAAAAAPRARAARSGERRSGKAAARAAAVDGVAPAPVRQSSRLRAKAAAAVSS